MWILPKTYQQQLAFVPDMLESSKDLSLLESQFECSLMWRSKPSLLRTWSLRWKRENWVRLLFLRMLKPSHHGSFEALLTTSLRDTRASLLARQVNERALKTLGISGRSFTTTSPESILAAYSARTWRDTSASGSKLSSKTFKDSAIEQRGAYSARARRAQASRENGSTLWLTPTTSTSVEKYETYRARMEASSDPKNTGKTRPANLAMQVQMHPTPTAGEAEHAGPYSKGQMGQSLSAKARRGELSEGQLWPAPIARDYKGSVTAETLASKGRNPMTNSLPDAVLHKSGAGYLNPLWVEWLMGVPTEWTELGSWETE